eukprot:scaffold300179_cov13-Tisochrysis_lutea.AAC.1
MEVLTPNKDLKKLFLNAVVHLNPLHEGDADLVLMNESTHAGHLARQSLRASSVALCRLMCSSNIIPRFSKNITGCE